MSCEDITFDELFNTLVDPAGISNFVNDNYVAPGDSDPYFKMQIYVGDTAKYFEQHIDPSTIEFEENYGFEKGVLKFQIEDAGEPLSSLPFNQLPRAKQKVKFLSHDESLVYFTGRIAKVKPTPVNQRENNTLTRFIDIVCTDLTGEFDRFTVDEIWENQTSGFIIKDLVNRFTTLDSSQIDATAGFTLTRITANGEKPSYIINRLMDLELTWTIWVDPETERVYVGEKVATLTNILTVTDDRNQPNWVYRYFDIDKFHISTNSEAVGNRIRFYFNRKHNDGTVNTSNGNNTILGTNTNFTRLQAGEAKIQIDGDTDVYSIQKVNNDTDIYASSPYQGTTQTGVGYTAYGQNDYVVIDDTESQLAMASLLNESDVDRGGVFDVKIVEQKAMTRDEALSYAEAYKQRLATNLLADGKAETTNSEEHIGSTLIRAGHVMTMNLPSTWGVDSEIVVQQVKYKATGAPVDRADGSKELHFDIKISFTDRILAYRNQLDYIINNLKKMVIADEGTIETMKSILEKWGIVDCVDVISPVDLDETFNLSDTPLISEFDADVVYYTTDSSGNAGVGQTAAYTWNLDNHAITAAPP